MSYRRWPDDWMESAKEFVDRVDGIGSDGCWVWRNRKDHDGYGSVKVHGRIRRAHRFSYETFVGPIPEGMVVCHRCDNPPCVRPDHLFVGTVADNNADRNAKCRQSRGPRLSMALKLANRATPVGEAHGRSKLTESQVAEIRELLTAGALSQSQIAKRFGVCTQTVNLINVGHNWRHSAGAFKRCRGVRRKITFDQAEEMRAKYASGMYQREIAAEYGVSRSVVLRVVNGLTYVQPDPE